MALTETGHARNVANFEDLIQRLEAAGNKYNPSREVLKLSQLKQQFKQGRNAMQEVTSALPLYSAVVDARQTLWKDVDKLATRAYNLFKASVSDPAEAETALSYLRKLRGTRKTAAPKPDGAKETRSISTAQRSFDLMTQNLEQFIQLLASNSSYTPNEEDLKVSSLRNLVDNIKVRSNKVETARATLDAARTNRDNILYAEGVGMVAVGQAVKTYIRGGFTPATTQYKPILAIAFKAISQ